MTSGEKGGGDGKEEGGQYGMGWDGIETRETAITALHFFFSGLRNIRPRQLRTQESQEVDDDESWISTMYIAVCDLQFPHVDWGEWNPI